MDIDRVLDLIAHPAIQLAPDGRVIRANPVAYQRFSWLQTGLALADVAPNGIGAGVAAVWESSEPEIPLEGLDARLLRIADDRRLLLFDLPEVKELLAREEQYRSLVTNLPVAVWTLDSPGGLVFISPRPERISGYTAEEMLSPEFRAIAFTSIHPDDLPRVISSIESLFRDRTAFEVEYRFRTKDGVWRWLSDHAVRPYEREGRLLASGITLDVTERKRAEIQQLALAAFGRLALTSTDERTLIAEACRIAAEGLEATAVDVYAGDVEGNGLAAPIRGRTANYGVLRVKTDEPRAFSERDEAFAQSIANVLAEAMERHYAESALREHERRLQVIVSRLPVMLFSTDANLRLTSLTGEGFAPMTDSTLADLSLTLEDVIGPEPEEGGPRAALAGRDTTYDTSHGDRHLRVHIEPLTDDSSARVIGVVGIAFDATEEKRAADANLVLLGQLHDAARQWRETFDSIQAPILIVDDEALVCRMNAAALRFSRFSAYQEAIEQPLASFGDAPIWAELEKLARAAAQTREAVAQHTDADGRVWELMASSGHGQTIILVSEVTEVMRMQERLRRAELMSQMGALVAGVAHEVRNPLFGISATLDAFESKFGTDLYRDYVAALREQVTRMSHLMHELLEYGRPIESDLRLHDPSAVLRRALESMEALARQRDVKIAATVPSGLPAVLMDRERLLQVFENLLKNAIEHSAAGGEVQMRAAVSEDGTSLNVEVADRGPGFSAEDLPRIFEPFFTRRRGGTGLGLSLVRRIVDEHHGTIRAGNRLGGGASMVVNFPVAEAAGTG